MKPLSVAAALAFISIASGPAQSQPGRYAPVGSLNCTMSGSVGAIIVGVQELRCVFTPTLGPPETWPQRPVVLPEGWKAIRIDHLWVRGRPYRLEARHGQEATLEPVESA